VPDQSQRNNDIISTHKTGRTNISKNIKKTSFAEDEHIAYVPTASNDKRFYDKNTMPAIKAKRAAELVPDSKMTNHMNEEIADEIAWGNMS